MMSFRVATKAVVFNDKGQYLILKKSSEEDINPDTFDLPGGRIHFGEKLEEAVIREVSEETGLIVKPIKVFNAWTFLPPKNFQLVGVDFICQLESGEGRLSKEHGNLFWMSYEEIIRSEQFPEWLKKTVKKGHELLSY